MLAVQIAVARLFGEMAKPTARRMRRLLADLAQKSLRTHVISPMVRTIGVTGRSIGQRLVLINERRVDAKCGGAHIAHVLLQCDAKRCDERFVDAKGVV